MFERGNSVEQLGGRVRFDHLHLSGRERSRLIENDDVDVAEPFKDRFVEDDDPAPERTGEALRDRQRRRESERPRRAGEEDQQREEGSVRWGHPECERPDAADRDGGSDDEEHGVRRELIGVPLDPMRRAL